MTDPAPVTTPPTARRGYRPAARVVSGTQTLLGPLWVTTFREPVRTGRLRLDGLSGPERQLAKVGLVTMVLLLASLLFVSLWRRGPLLHLAIVEQPQFVPQGLLPVTLVALFIALSLIVWGALDASPVVRVVVATLYVATMSILGSPTVFAVNDSWILEHGPTLLRIGYWTPVGALVLSALLHRWERARRWATPLLRLVCLLAFVTMLVSMLWMDAEFAAAGFQGSVQSTVHSGFTSIDGFLIPLVYVTAVAVIDFATDVSTSVAEPVAGSRGRLVMVVRGALLLLVLGKLWIELVSERDYWATHLTHQPVTVIRTVLVISLLAAVTFVVHRIAPPGPDAAVDEAKEKLTFGAAFLLTAASLVGIFLLGVAELVVSVSGKDWGIELADKYPLDQVSDWLPLLAAVASVGVGSWLVTRGSDRLGLVRSREFGTGLIILGTWNLPAWTINVSGYALGFSYPAVDVLVTVAVLAWLIVRWRRIDAVEGALLLAVVLFSWLVMSRGDYISFLGGLLGLPAVVVVVFGILYTLLSGSGFTSESSKRLPRESRSLMFVGYLLLSVTILHWLEAIHSSSSSNLIAVAGFYFLGIPLAAWLLSRRIIPRGRALNASLSDEDPPPPPELVQVGPTAASSAP